MFCRYCGTELPENAVVCLKCGCLVNGTIANVAQNEPIAPQMIEMQPTIEAQPIMGVQTIETQPKKPSRKFFRLTKIFSIVATVLSCVTVVCALWFFVLMYAALSAGNTDGVNYGGMAVAIFAILGLYGMFAVSPFALTTGILAFVFKKKSVEKTGAFPIVAFVLGIISFAVTILFVVLLCL